MGHLKTLGLATIALFFAFQTANAQHPYYPESFQRQVKNKSFLKDGGQALEKALFKVLDSRHQKRHNQPDVLGCRHNRPGKCYGHKNLGYTGARKQLFGDLYLKEDSRGRHYIEDVYCQKKFTRRVGPGRIPNHRYINTEHTWPQSKFTGRFSSGLQKSDLHHLFPTDSRSNSRRGSFTFAEVDGEPAGNDCSSSRVGSDVRTGHSTHFEPPEEHKGNVARALFYFAVRYQTDIDRHEEAYLRKWHREDPVDEAERERNNAIYLRQNNRNPFIDYPELVGRIDDF